VRRDLSNSCGKSHANSRDMASSAPWWYATELQAVQKIAEQHSQDLKRVESTLCGLQLRMTQNTNGLAQRVEALERRSANGNGTHETVIHLARGCHKDTQIGHLDALAASLADLETRYELFSSDTTAKMASCTTALSELREQTRDGTDSDLQACIQNASSHVLRLEKLSAKWTELQKVQGSSDSPDRFQKTIRDTVKHCMKELLPEVKGGHRRQNPQCGKERQQCFVQCQPSSLLPAVLTFHSTPVTPRSLLQRYSYTPPPAASRFPVGSCSLKQEL